MLFPCDYATQWSFSLNLLILEILSPKIAFTKLQLETANGHQLYKNVHKNGEKKKVIYL